MTAFLVELLDENGDVLTSWEITGPLDSELHWTADRTCRPHSVRYSWPGWVGATQTLPYPNRLYKKDRYTLQFEDAQA